MSDAPEDAAARRAVEPVICYPVETLPAPDMALYTRASETLAKTGEVVVPPRDARCFEVPAGHFFRITSVEPTAIPVLDFTGATEDLAQAPLNVPGAKRLTPVGPRPGCLSYAFQISLPERDPRLAAPLQPG